jgi:hypothetical protein
MAQIKDDYRKIPGAAKPLPTFAVEDFSGNQDIDGP